VTNLVDINQDSYGCKPRYFVFILLPCKALNQLG